jgi:hypothetical protein
LSYVAWRSPPDPRYATSFEWDSSNEEHPAQHDVSSYEVEQVFRNDPQWRRNKGGRSAQYVMDGRTDAGRSLRVLVTWADEAERVSALSLLGIDRRGDVMPRMTPEEEHELVERIDRVMRILTHGRNSLHCLRMPRNRPTAWGRC